MQLLNTMSFSVQRWNGTGSHDANELRQLLESEGYSSFEWSDSAGTAYPPHSHADDHPHWIISGSLELTVHGETYTLNAGDRDYLPANTIHSAFVPGSQRVRYLIGAKRR